MRRKSVPFIAALLALLMLSGVFAACSNGGGNTDVTLPADTSEQIDPSLAARYAIADNLPAMDFDGNVFLINALGVSMETLYTEESNGEIVNDALYDAIDAVETRFNVDIQPVEASGDDFEHAANLKIIASSGEESFSLVTGHDALCGNLALEGVFTNLWDIPHLNFEKPWWHGVEEHTVLGQYYCGISDMSYLGMDRSKVIYVNKQKIEDEQMEVPYQAVFDKTWTLDMLISMTKDVYRDLNGNQQKDEEDFYGYSTEPNCYGYLESFGLETTIKNEDEVLTVDFDIEKMDALVNKLYDWFFETEGGSTTMVNNKYPSTEFSEGKLLFAHGNPNQAINVFRHVLELQYGILPMPLYDEAQEEYITMLETHPVMVPASVPFERYEEIGIVLEALNAEGYKRVYPAYYEVALKQKFTMDDESIRVLDIVNETKSASFSWMYENWAGFNQTLYNMIMAKNNNFSSYYAANITRAEARVKTLVKAFEKYEP